MPSTRAQKLRAAEAHEKSGDQPFATTSSTTAGGTNSDCPPPESGHGHRSLGSSGIRNANSSSPIFVAQKPQHSALKGNRSKRKQSGGESTATHHNSRGGAAVNFTVGGESRTVTLPDDVVSNTGDGDGSAHHHSKTLATSATVRRRKMESWSSSGIKEEDLLVDSETPLPSSLSQNREDREGEKGGRGGGEASPEPRNTLFGDGSSSDDGFPWSSASELDLTPRKSRSSAISGGQTARGGKKKTNVGKGSGDHLLADGYGHLNGSEGSGSTSIMAPPIHPKDLPEPRKEMIKQQQQKNNNSNNKKKKQQQQENQYKSLDLGSEINREKSPCPSISKKPKPGRPKRVMQPQPFTPPKLPIDESDEDEMLDSPGLLSPTDRLTHSAKKTLRQGGKGRGGDKEGTDNSLSGAQRKIKMMSRMAFLSDIATVVISISDIVSDVAVAYQFYEGGHLLWFWLVILSLFMSSVCYSIFWTEEFVPNYSAESTLLKKVKTLPKWARYVTSFFYSQIIPILVWYYEVEKLKAEEAAAEEEKRNQKAARPTKWPPKKTTSHMREGLGMDRAGSNSWEELALVAGSAAAAEEIQAVTEQGELMAAMQKGLDAHFKSHILFYIETVVEAIPQSVIQLLAVTYLGEATYWQLFSMCLSLSSIVSKAYVLSQASDIRLFLTRFVLAANDVFSLFYICATICASNYSDLLTSAGVGNFDDEENPSVNGVAEGVSSVVVKTAEGFELTLQSVTIDFWHLGQNQLWTTALSAFLIKKWLWIVTCWVILMAGFGYLAIKEVERKMRSGTRFRHAVDWTALSVIVLFFVLLFVPFAIALEGIKFLLLILFMQGLESNGGQKTWPAALALRTFMENAETTQEYNHRTAYVIQRLTQRNLEVVQKENSGSFHEINCKIVLEMTQKPEFKSLDVFKKFVIGGHDALKEKQKADKAAAPKPAAIPRMTRIANWLKVSRPIWRERVEAFVGLSFVVGVFLPSSIFGAIFSSCFPLLNVYYYGVSNQNIYQTFCLGCCTLCLTVIIVTSPLTFKSLWASAALKKSLDGFNMAAHPLKLRDALGWVAEYHKPTGAQVVGATLPRSLIPFELADHVGKFLPADSLETAGMSLAECNQLRQSTVVGS